MLRFFFLCVMAMVLPVNTVLAQMPAHAKIAAVQSASFQAVQAEHAQHHADNIPAASASHHAAPVKELTEQHLHHGLFGKVSAHTHEPAPQADCIKACQAIPGSMLINALFVSPLPLNAVLVGMPVAALAGITVPPLEDPPKIRA
ncbi:hypothetical protein [Chitinibacter sp. GC72]|uniref:hypothetical protein n=1 Tax=Chitinibacter sp. GC72 TaxID=1526917 RepID=UPI0012FBBA7D|nr:hypothetical protein [Chitinibacter sp. GC72]